MPDTPIIWQDCEVAFEILSLMNPHGLSQNDIAQCIANYRGQLTQNNYASGFWDGQSVMQPPPDPS